MNPDQTLFQLLDDYRRGLLSDAETREVQERMNNDAAFRKQTEEYFELTANLKFYGDRNALKKDLDEIHNTMMNESNVSPVATTRKISPWKKYWPMTAVAASVAFLSILGTVLITQSLETKQTAYYKELRRNVEQIKKSQKQIIADINESKGNAMPGKYSGTGFLISPNGYVATSHHVIKDADSIIIENETFGRLRTLVVHSDPLNDIAILKIDNPEFESVRSLPFTISSQEADLGEYVYTLGFPREDIVFGEGSVSASTGFRQNPNAYQISVPVNPGNSGGPLLNEKGDLIGMISGIQTETSGAAFAIKSSRLLSVVKHETLDSLQAPLTLPKYNTLKNTGRVQQIKKWRQFVFMVRVYNSK